MQDLLQMHAKSTDIIENNILTENNMLLTCFIFMRNTIQLDDAALYLFKFNNRNYRKGCEICSKLTKKQQHQNDVNISIVDFKQVNVSGTCYEMTK